MGKKRKRNKRDSRTTELVRQKKYIKKIMGRINKTIDGVFVDIVGDNSKLSGYDQFLNQGGKNSSRELNELTNDYKSLITKHRQVFEQLAALEEIIMQLRIRENLGDIKLSQVREYVYARTPFYRKDKVSKDVRVIVEKIEFYPEGMEDINNLFGNQEFMDTAKYKLAKSIDVEISENIRCYKRDYLQNKNK
jgi:hypothetical protein